MILFKRDDRSALGLHHACVIDANYHRRMWKTRRSSGSATLDRLEWENDVEHSFAAAAAAVG